VDILLETADAADAMFGEFDALTADLANLQSGAAEVKQATGPDLTFDSTEAADMTLIEAVNMPKWFKVYHPMMQQLIAEVKKLNGGGAVGGTRSRAGRGGARQLATDLPNKRRDKGRVTDPINPDSTASK